MSNIKFQQSREKIKIEKRLHKTFLASKDTFRNIMKSTFLISLGTLFSRILGFFRDVIFARLLGTSMAADAFYMAFRIPNMFRNMVGEGAINSAVVPIFSEYLHKKNRASFWNLASVIFVWSLIVLAVLTLLGMLFTPWIVKIMAPGFLADPAKFDLTVNLTWIIFPYLILIGLTAFAMGVLFTFRSFWVPSFSPIYLNLALVGGALMAGRFSVHPVYVISVCVLIGGLWQLLAHIPPIMKEGLRFKCPKTLNHPGAVRIGKLLIPRMFGSGVYQLGLVIDSFCASLSAIVGEGGISAIYYANRIVQFPLGMFGVALASAVLPSFAGFASNKDMVSFKRTLVFTLENIFFVMFPTVALLTILSTPIIRVLFERGIFDSYSTQITASSLLYFSFGLFGYGGLKILVSAFHALQDTKTPVIIGVFALIVNTILNFVLMFPFKIGGIAMATSIASLFNFIALLIIMRKRLGGFESDLLKYTIKITLATIVTAALLYLEWAYLPIPAEWLKIGVVSILTYGVYEIICLALGVKQAYKVWELIFKKK